MEKTKLKDAFAKFCLIAAASGVLFMSGHGSARAEGHMTAKDITVHESVERSVTFDDRTRVAGQVNSEIDIKAMEASRQKANKAKTVRAKYAKAKANPATTAASGKRGGR